MTRWVSSTNEAAAAEVSVVFALLVDLDFATGIVRVHNGLGTLMHAGNTYGGLGDFGSIDIDPEDTEVGARGARFVLTGIPRRLVPDVLAEQNYQGRPVTLYIGILNSATREWVATPEEVWSGFMDFIDMPYEGTEVRVILNVEDELRREPQQARYTDEDQQLRFPGDRFFSDLPNIIGTRAVWGQQPQTYSGGGTRPTVPPQQR